MKDREETWIGACSLQHGLRFESVKVSSHATGREATSPFVEVSKDDAGPSPNIFSKEIDQSSALVAALSESGAEVQIENMDCARDIELQIDAQAAARFATEVGEVVIVERLDGNPTQRHVAVRAAMKYAIFSNAPVVARERVSEMPGLIEFSGTVADVKDLLHADHVGVELLENAGDTGEVRLAIHSTALVDVIRRNSKVLRVRLHCCCWMIQPKNSGMRSMIGRLCHSSYESSRLSDKSRIKSCSRRCVNAAPRTAMLTSLLIPKER